MKNQTNLLKNILNYFQLNYIDPNDPDDRNLNTAYYVIRAYEQAAEQFSDEEFKELMTANYNKFCQLATESGIEDVWADIFESR